MNDVLTQGEVASYRNDGVLIPNSRLDDVTLAELRGELDRFLETTTSRKADFVPNILDHQPEWLRFAMLPAILDPVRSLIGDDVILWGSGLFCKAAAGGRGTPWHQDGHYWPIRPLATVTAWIAIDDIDTSNGRQPQHLGTTSRCSGVPVHASDLSLRPGLSQRTGRSHGALQHGRAFALLTEWARHQRQERHHITPSPSQIPPHQDKTEEGHQTMKAIAVQGDELVWGDAPSPEMGAGEVRIRNRATAVNRADLAQRAGAYPPPPGASVVLGLECAGTVEEIGADVSGLSVGDEVCALLAGGGSAEEVVVPAGQVLPIPKGLSFTEAAALPEVFATAYLNLFMEAALSPGERVLLHAGASGVGTAGIQLCQAFGNPVYVTAGSDDKIERCVALGAAGGSNRKSGGFADKVSEWTDGNGFDVILDPVGAAYLEDNINSLNMDGRLVIIGLMGGAKTELALPPLMMRRLRIIGSTLRARPIGAKTAVMQALQEKVWPLVESGQIKPIVEEVIPIAEASRAHELIASDTTFGKVVLEIS